MQESLLGLEKIKIKKDEREKEMYTSEIIDEFLIPIISNFSNEDRISTEKILKLIWLYPLLKQKYHFSDRIKTYRTSGSFRTKPQTPRRVRENEM